MSDRFDILGPAAAGGMGRVLRAFDRATGQEVALKLLHADAELPRFAREARLLADLFHPALARHVAHGTLPTGEPYLATRWIEGETLAARLARGPLRAPEATALARRVATALAALHALGIVHRDVKPANLLLPKGDPARAVLVDLGVARAPLAGGATTVTRTGAALGTPAYMAPEQVRGSRALDGRADLFALGCVLHECLAGRPAFSGDDELAILQRVLTGQPDTLVIAVPGHLARLLARLLAKDPAARPPSAAAVIARLDGVPENDEAAGSAPWYAARGAVARELAVRLDRDGLLALLGQAGMPAIDEPARRAQLRVLADGAVLLLELGAFDLGAALADRVAQLAGALLLPDEESAALVAAARAQVAARCGALGEARDEASQAARGFAAAGDEPRALAARATVADLSAELGDLVRARAEADALLARRDLPAAVEARARLASGKVLLAGLAATDARLMLRRVAAIEPWIHGRALILLARAALRAGHATLAESEARAALAILDGLPDVAVAAQAVLAQALVKQRRISEALVASRAAGATRPAPDLSRAVVVALAQLGGELCAHPPSARTA